MISLLYHIIIIFIIAHLEKKKKQRIKMKDDQIYIDILITLIIPYRQFRSYIIIIIMFYNL